MKPPKCRLCEHEHWTNEPHRFGRLDAVGTKGGKASVTTTVTTPGVTNRYVKVVCSQCVTKDSEIAGLRNQLAAATKRADEWAKISVEVDQNHRKKAKRDRAAYMREYRAAK